MGQCEPEDTDGRGHMVDSPKVSWIMLWVVASIDKGDLPDSESSTGKIKVVLLLSFARTQGVGLSFY